MRRLGSAASLGLIILVLGSALLANVKAQAPLVTSVPNMISVVTGTDGGLYWNSFSNTTVTWSGWQPLSGASPSPPELCQSGHGSVELVVRGYDDGIYHKSFINGTWSSTWDKVPTGVTSDTPACAVLGTIMYMVVRGTDNNLWANTLDLNTVTWSPWINLGGSTPSTPALVASPSINALDLVVRGEDDRIYHSFHASGSWSAFELQPCGIVSTISTPAIVSGNLTGTALVQVAIRNSADNQILTLVEYAGRSWLPTTCHGWQAVGGQSTNAPTLALDLNVGGVGCIHGTVYALWRGLDNSLFINARCFELVFDWGSGGSLGGYITNRPAGAVFGRNNSGGPNYIGIVVSGAASDLWYMIYPNTGWTGMTGATAMNPGLIAVP